MNQLARFVIVRQEDAHRLRAIAERLGSHPRARESATAQWVTARMQGQLNAVATRVAAGEVIVLIDAEILIARVNGGDPGDEHP